MIRLLVDASSDYSMEEIKEKNFYFVPINVTIGSENYIEGVNLEHNDFYSLLKNNGDFPKTSQPSPQTFLDIFNEVKEKNDELICILLSSQLSGTYQSALVAKSMADYDKIYIIDSLSATFTIKVMADYALSLIEQNLTVEEIVEETEKFKSHVKCIACLDTLEFLAKGGRLSKTAAAIGNAANIKPIITLTEDGRVEVIAKCIGKSRASAQMIKILQGMNIDERFPMYSVYSFGTENCETFENKLEENGFKLNERLQIGPVIGTHIGPGGFGAIFVTRGE